MNEQRKTRSDITEMTGAASLPRKSGEMVFHDDWERRGFAIAVSLAEQGLFQWSEFQQHLIEAVAEAEQGDRQRGYYESWLVALEKSLKEKQLLVDCVD
jgi:nitrile hydratase accessory protein